MVGLRVLLARPIPGCLVLEKVQLLHRQANKPPKGARTNMARKKVAARMPGNLVDPQNKRKGDGITRAIAISDDEPEDFGFLFSEIVPQRYSRLFEDDKWTQEQADQERTLMHQNWRVFRQVTSKGFHAVECDKVSNTQHAKPEQ